MVSLILRRQQTAQVTTANDHPTGEKREDGKKKKGRWCRFCRACGCRCSFADGGDGNSTGMAGEKQWRQPGVWAWATVDLALLPFQKNNGHQFSVATLPPSCLLLLMLAAGKSVTMFTIYLQCNTTPLTHNFSNAVSLLRPFCRDNEKTDKIMLTWHVGSPP